MTGFAAGIFGRHGRLAAMLLMVMAVACAAPARAGDGLRKPDLEQARRLYAQLKAASEEQRARQTLELAGTLLDYYPAFDRNDEVLVLAMEAAAKLKDLRQSLSLADEMLARHPGSPLVDGALERAASIAVAGGDSLRAAHYRLLYYDRDPARGQRDDGVPRCASLMEKLSAGQLADLVVFHPGSALVPYLQCLRVRRLVDADRLADARTVAAELEAASPGDRWTVEALRRLGVAQPGDVVAQREPEGPVRRSQVGVLCPQSGEYAALGGAFLEAARLAVADANKETKREFTLVVEDTGGDPVSGALAARRLCGERGTIALFGDLWSDPTTAAAVVAGQFGTPLVSPTATNDRIWEIGPNIFQTNLTALYEPRLLARLAGTVLLKNTYAVLYPDEPEGRRHADAFRLEVERLGGRVVALVAMDPTATDFQAALQDVRKARPEVVFVPAGVDLMTLLAPQLDLLGAGALVMGLSTWNSPALLERVGPSLDGAIFPHDYPLYPPAWQEAFAAAWQPDLANPEADQLALRSYQSMRMLLDTMSGSGARTRAGLAEALRRRLSREELDVSGPESFAGTVRVVREGQATPFPAALYAAGWAAGQAVPTPPAAAPAGVPKPAGGGH